jgi:cytoskeletal protein RodZ
VEQPPRSTLLPVLLTVIVMLLLGVFGVGIWLLLSNRPTPLPPEQSTETAATTTQATSAATTATTSATATTNTVPMPDIVGKTYADAAAALTAVGLIPDRHDEFSDTVPAGTVISADKPKDTPVAPGTVISVIVSKGPQATATATPTATATATATDGATKTK